MKLLFFHAKDLRLEVGLKGPPSRQRQAEKFLRRKLGDTLSPINESNRSTESKNALLVFVCAEKGDEAIDLARAKEDIIKARALLGVADIVIGAFGHLSDQIAEPRLARRIIDDLASLVSSAYPSTLTFPFGWDKSLDLHVPLHHFNASFKSYSYEDTFWDSSAADFEEYMRNTGHYTAQERLLHQFSKSGHLHGSQIVDVCCGSGFALECICRLSQAQLFGLDASEKMLTMAEKRLAASPDSNRLVRGRAEYVDLLFNNQFDTVLAINATAYVDMQLFLSRLKAVTTPKAKLIVMDEDPFLSGFAGISNPKMAEQVRRYTISELKAMVAEKGYTQKEEIRTSIDQKHDLVGIVFELI